MSIPSARAAFNPSRLNDAIRPSAEFRDALAELAGIGMSVARMLELAAQVGGGARVGNATLVAFQSAAEFRRDPA